MLLLYHIISFLATTLSSIENFYFQHPLHYITFAATPYHELNLLMRHPKNSDLTKFLWLATLKQ